MTTPQRRPGPEMGWPAVPGQKDSSAILDRLVREGRITPGQAAQYRTWESAKPPIDGGRQRFDAWMASRPNLPGMPRMGPPAGEVGRRPVFERRAAPAFPDQKTVLETVDKYERENKITEAQAELVRRWERKRPGTVVGSEGFDAWMKLRPDVPGLKELWGEHPTT